MQASLSFEQLSDTFRRGCKPIEQWRIGTEHEKFGFHLHNLKPLAYNGPSGIAQVLQGFMQFGWQPILESNQPIALIKNGASISLEPGGQFELSGAPLKTIHDTYIETKTHFDELHIICEALNIDFLCAGFQPTAKRSDITWMPKSRYGVMRNYMPKVGNMGLDMMLRTATVQANLDFDTESDMRKKMRIGYALQPLITALYAASPFVEGKPTGHLSQRGMAWLDTDANRTGVPKCVFHDDFGFDAWAQWVLDVPMYFVIRDGQYIDCAGQSFRAFLDGKLPQLMGQYPSLDDWELHTSTVFPDVRLKQYIEMRGAAAGNIDWICSLPALWKGLLYDAQALDDAWHLTQDWSRDDIVKLRQEAPKTALATSFRNTTIHALCHAMLDISEAGLQRLQHRNHTGQDESIYLEPLKQVVSTGKTRADVWLASYHHEWKQSVTPLFTQACNNRV